ncbi:MAG: hypothetical protein HY756_11065 [Nitrospirae bacterium]|nr:hypothetical protein [Nitrospirota bacterium]
MKLLVDVGVGRKVEEWLKADGHDTKAMRDIDPKAKDSEWAIKNKGLRFYLFQFLVVADRTRGAC